MSMGFKTWQPSGLYNWQYQTPSKTSTTDSLEEYFVQNLIDSLKHGKDLLYLVCWTGYGLEHHQWLVGSMLENCTAMDGWMATGVEAS